MNKPGISILFLLFIVFCSCSKSNKQGSFTITPNSTDISCALVIDPSSVGIKIPDSFTGLSYETSSMSSTSYFASGFTKHINMIRNLGNQGILRIGANSSDEMFWANTPRNGSRATDSVYTDEVDRYFDFVQEVGWPTIFGLNLARGTQAEATSEAQYVSGKYASTLLYYELGNEPDLYHLTCRPLSYGVSDYELQFDSFYSKIIAVVPDAKFAGPANAYNVGYFTQPFLNDRHANLSQAEEHYYVEGPAGSSGVTLAKILVDDSNLVYDSRRLVKQAAGYNMPFRWSECNSVYNGGQLGISNTLGSALWGANYMFSLASFGCAGVNFHGGGNGPYTPIAYSNGDVSARPLYYGMLAFKTGSRGSFISNTFTPADSINIRVYTVIGNDGKYYVTIINRDFSNEAFVRVTGLPVNQNTNIIRLTGSDVASPDSVMLGNATVDASGNWSSQSTERAGTDNLSYQLKIPKTSIAILVIGQ